MSGTFLTVITIVLLLFILIFVFTFMRYISLWVSARLSNVNIGLIQLFVMQLRKVPPATIVNSMITATKAGIPVDRDGLEAHFLAGGNVMKVVSALISADKANISLTFKEATAIDLAGRDVFEAVQLSVNPKVIESPPVTAVAKDGIDRKSVV